MIRRFFIKFTLFLSKRIFNLLSDKKHLNQKIFQNIYSPLLLLGEGNIIISDKTNLGVFNAPKFYFSYIHIEAREKNSRIFIKENVFISNSVTIISMNTEIYISENVLIGHDVQIYDSDFHSTKMDERKINKLNYKDEFSVFLGKNCWIGSNSIILKGVKIGENSVIAANSIVTKNVPSNVVYGGIPAKFIKKIDN